jgi:hypothetical protein
MSDAEFLESLRPTLEDVEQNHGYRERFENPDRQLESLPAAAPKLAPDDCNKLISNEAHDLVWSFEVDGRKGYERKYCHPCRPPDPSGITIGLGYDLGYCTPHEFEADWQTRLSTEDYQHLRGAVGLKSGSAQGILAGVREIVVPWDAAEGVYRKNTVPKYVNWMIGIFPGADKLHPHCSGALFSLVYNRGSDLRGDRRSEMRNIADAIRAGKPEAIPNEFRAMRRLWPDIAGLRRRREAEANLFERGLVEMDRQRREVPMVVAAAAAAEGSLRESFGGPAFVPPTHDGDGQSRSNDDYDPSIIGAAPLDKLEALPAWAAVRWVEDDDLSTEYRHIVKADRWLKDASFLFCAADLELLIRANHFQPLRTEKRVIFGLRGALLDHDTANLGDGAAQVNRQTLRLKVCRPDHQNFRCVVGVYNTETQLLSGFIATTVPNRVAVWSHHAGGDASNMLACGCYRYRVGPHKGHDGCLRQDEPVAVLRSKDNVVYDVKDTWDTGWPMDNIHPACGDKSHSALFSSWGCQTPRGWFGDGAFTDEFAKFRSALGLRAPGSDNDRLFSYVLLTGHEAAIASHLRTTTKDTDHAAVRMSLARLRQGSEGEPVRRLQAELKLKIDGRLGAAAKLALANAQRQRAGELAGDGIYSPALDEAWGLAVFGEKVAPPLAPAAPMVVASAASAVLRESAGGARLVQTFEAIYFEIGRRAKFAAARPELLTAAVVPHYEAIDQTSWKSTADLGERVFNRVERMANELICGDLQEDTEDRRQIHAELAGALGQGSQFVVPVLSKVLTGHLLVPTILAGPIAEIIVGRTAATSSSGQLPITVDGFSRAWGGRLLGRALGQVPSREKAA